MLMPQKNPSHLVNYCTTVISDKMHDNTIRKQFTELANKNYFEVTGDVCKMMMKDSVRLYNIKHKEGEEFEISSHNFDHGFRIEGRQELVNLANLMNMADSALKICTELSFAITETAMTDELRFHKTSGINNGIDWEPSRDVHGLCVNVATKTHNPRNLRRLNRHIQRFCRTFHS